MFKTKLHYCFFLMCCWMSLLPAASAQEAVEAEMNPYFEVRKVDLPNSLKHKSIVGKLADGRLLIQCTTMRQPPDGRVKRQYFWVKAGQENTIEVKPFRANRFGIRELTFFDRNRIFYTQEDHGVYSFYLARVDEQGNIFDKQAVLTDWQHEIRHPFIFKLGIADNPTLIFSSKAEGRNDYDLYISDITLPSWSRPRPVANIEINTRYNETHPYVSKDGLLFFSTDRPVDLPGGTQKNSTNIWFVKSGLNGFEGNATINPLPGPFSSASRETDMVVLEERLREGFFISDRERNRRELYHFSSTRSSVSTLPPRYHALIVGVDDYPAMPVLEKPVKNGKELADLLRKEYGFEVDLLANPNSSQIIDKLRQYRNLHENEYLLIAFFGHGVKLRGSDNRPVCKLAGIDGRGDGTNCISPDDYAHELSLISRPKHILTILDACWSGLFQTNMRSEFDKRSRKVMTSTEKYIVPDESAFFNYLIGKLQDNAKGMEEIMTGAKLFHYIYGKMEEAAKLNINQNQNKPAYFDFLGSDGGDFPFQPARL